MARAKFISIYPIFIGLFCSWLGASAQSQSTADSAASRTLRLVNPYPVDSSQTQLVKIDKIFLLGNKKTKDHIILRELNVNVGDLINRSDLDLILERDKQKILNTRLFLDAKINVISLSEHVVDIVVQVSERWYIFPIPIFQLADRNFNEWWVNQNRDLSRVNYGMKFYHRNFRGRGERLKLTAQLGFTKVLGLSYSVPYVDRAQRNGFIYSASYSESKDVGYKTFDHRQLFLDSEEIQSRGFRTQLTWSHRYSFDSYNFVTLGFNRLTIGDTIANLNPDYFLNGRTRQKYFSLSYRYRKDLRDNVAYPLNGMVFNFKAEKLGLGLYDDLNTVNLSASYAKYFNLQKNYYLSGRIGGTIAWPDRLPYLQQQTIGFRPNFIRGHELSLIQGKSFFLSKLTLKKLLFSGEKTIGAIPVTEFQTIPFAFYLKTFFDSGIVNNNSLDSENERLTNRYLFGTGVGLDIVTYYDTVIRLEYALNNEGKDGFFLNLRVDF